MEKKKEIYRRFFERHRDTFPISMYPWYLETMTSGHWSTALVKKGEDVLAVWPYYLKKKFSFSYITMPVLTKWCGPIFHPDLSDKKKDSILKELMKDMPSVAFQDQNFPYPIQDWSPYHWLGLKQEIKYSFRIDLSPTLESIKSHCNKRYQNIIDTFPIDTFSIEETDDVSAFYTANAALFASKKLKIPYTEEQLSSQYLAVKKHEAGALFYIKDDAQRIHSQAFMLWDNSSSYLHVVVDDPSLRQSKASLYLIWYLIKYSKEKLQKSYFDFEGSMIKSVQEIRRNFGGEQIPYHRAYRYPNPWIRLYKNWRS